MKGIRNLSSLSIKGLEMHFMAVKKSRNCSGFVIYSYFFKTVLLQQSKGIKYSGGSRPSDKGGGGGGGRSSRP